MSRGIHHRWASAAAILLVALAMGDSLSRAQPVRSGPWRFDVREIERRLRTAPMENLRPVGSSSTVFRVTLGSGLDAAWRPRTRTHGRGDLAELGAYRLAQLLAFETVPPVIARMMTRGDFDRQLSSDREHTFDYDEELRWERDVARGVLVYWVPGLRNAGFDREEGARRWKAWLSISSPMPTGADASLARDISDMLVFDYLIGNRDRMSGANFQTTEDGTRVVIRDHNLSFPTPFDRRENVALFQRVMQCERFSRRTVNALVALSESNLRQTLSAPMTGDDTRMPVLSERQVTGVIQRRAAVLSYIGATIAEHGPARVLAF